MNYQNLDEAEEDSSGYKIGLSIVVLGITIIVGVGIFSAAYYGNFMPTIENNQYNYDHVKL